MSEGRIPRVLVGSAALAMLLLLALPVLALVVSDDWQRHGLGRRLMGALIEVARNKGYRNIFGDVLGQTAWQIDPAWNVAHADRLWPEMKGNGWRYQSLKGYAAKVPHYQTGAQIKAQWEAKNPGKTFPGYDPGGMVKNLFLKQPGWRAAEGFGQPALGYPQ